MAKKPKTKNIAAEKKFIGGEPMLKTVKSETAVSVALTWYGYAYHVDNAAPWLYTYLERHGHSKKYIDRVKKIKPQFIGMTYCALARMANNGCDIGKYHDKIMKRVEENLYRVPEEEPKKLEYRIVDKVKEKTDEIIAELEAEIDHFILMDFVTDFEPYTYFKTNEVKDVQANAIILRYEPLLLELADALEGKDVQLKEGYKKFKKKDLQAYFDFIMLIIEDAGKVSNVVKAEKKIRKPRPVKQKPAALLVKDMKFCVSDSESKLASIDPVTVIGAKQLWVYNTKYRLLGCYKASDPNGFSVKGTTITGYDPATSVGKKLRKPEDMLPKVNLYGKVGLRSLLGEVKTAETKLNGRINQDTLLLRVLQ